MPLWTVIVLLPPPARPARRRCARRARGPRRARPRGRRAPGRAQGAHRTGRRSRGEPAPGGRRAPGARRGPAQLGQPAPRDARRVQPRDQDVSGVAGARGRERGVELGAVGYAARVGAEPVVAREPGVVEHLRAQARPLALVLHRDHHLLPVGRGDGPVGRDRRVRGAHRHGRDPGVAGVVERVGHPLGERPEQRHVHGQRLAGAVAVVQRGEHAAEGVAARGDVGDRDARPWPGRPRSR